MKQILYAVYANNRQEEYVTTCPYIKTRKVGDKACFSCKFFVREKKFESFPDGGGGEGIIICNKE